MPVVVPMKLRMSRRLELLKLNLSGVRSAGLSTGAPCARACWRSRSIAGRGRDFSMRSRMVRSSSARARRREAVRRVHLDGLLVLDQRARRARPSASSSRAARDVLARRVLRRPLELDLVFGVVGARLQRLRVVLHRRVPVAAARRVAPLAEGAARGAPRHQHGHDENAISLRLTNLAPISFWLQLPSTPALELQLAADAASSAILADTRRSFGRWSGRCRWNIR